eukprot:g30942.t1
MTALMYAAGDDHLSIAQFLVKEKADVNAKENDGQTALDRARKNGKTDMVAFLECAAKDTTHLEAELAATKAKLERMQLTAASPSTSGGYAGQAFATAPAPKASSQAAGSEDARGRADSVANPAPHPKRLGCIGASEVVKSLIPFFTVLCCRLRGQHFEIPIYASLLPVCLGVSLASATDAESSALGLLCALGSSMSQTLLNIISKDRNSNTEAVRDGGVVTDIVRRLGTICCGAVLFSKPMTLLNALGVVISLGGVITYTVVSRHQICFLARREGSHTDKSLGLEKLLGKTKAMSSLSSLSTDNGIDSLAISTQILHAMQAKRQLSFPVPFCTLSWEDLEVAYRTPHGRRITLHRQGGYVEGGCMMAIMGASGAGKSTLLDAWSGLGWGEGFYAMPGTGGTAMDGFEWFSVVMGMAFPTCDFRDWHQVGETVEFYAELTMQKQVSKEMRSRAVSERLQSVGLADKDRDQRWGLHRWGRHRHQETKFVGGRLPGGFSIRGLSGGERRRLNIAAGVVHSPPLVFLDEPTSGLDAFSALCVMESIRALARAGHVVACTIHQPRQAIVAMFDKVLFLACGHLVYNGPPSGLKDWLMKSELWDPDRALTTSITAPWMVSRVGVESSGFWGDPFRG